MPETSRHNTKSALIGAAERLFAEKGLGIVSVKEITRAAGARNPSAVHYHFGNVETLIKEVFARRYHGIEQERLKRFAQIAAADDVDRVLALLEAALGPFIETCQEEEGRLFVRFCVQLFTDPRFDAGQIIAEAGGESIAKLRVQLIASLGHIPDETLSRRLRQGFMISLLQADDYARRVEAGTAPPLKQAIREAASSLFGYLSAEPR